MSQDHQEPPPEDQEYREHQVFLRGQALRLTANEAEAEDLVHDTWLRYLRTPPAQVRSLRPWLYQVLRNRFIETRRTEVRRKDRYQRLDLREPAPSVADQISQAEIAGILSKAIDSLGQPYRAAIRLHFVEGLAAPEVAKRRGIPLETARSQIKRGVTLLRAKLESREHGRLQEWMGALVGLFRRKQQRLGGFSAGTVLAVAAAVTTAIVFSIDWTQGREVGKDLGAVHVSEVGRDASNLVSPERTALERVALAPAQEVVPLEVALILKHSGAAVGGAVVAAVSSADGVDGETLAAGVSDVAGRLTLEVPVQDTLALRIDATARSEAGRVEMLPIAPGSSNAARVCELSGVSAVDGRVETADGRPAEDILVEVIVGPYPHFLDGGPVLVVAATKTNARGQFHFDRAPVDACLLATNEDRSQHGIWGPPQGSRDDDLWNLKSEDPRKDYLDGPETPTIRLGLASSLDVQVLDPAGQPIERANVRIKGSEYTLRNGSTDAEGRVSFDLIGHRAQLVLTVEAEGYAHTVHGPFPLLAGMPEYVVSLESERSIEGRVVDRSGQPLPGARVRSVPVDAAPPPSTIEPPGVAFVEPARIASSVVTDANGRFLLRGLGSGTYSVQAEHGVSLFTAVRVKGGARDLLLPESSTAGALRFVGSIADASTGVPIRNALVCVERRHGNPDERVDQVARRLEGSDFSLVGAEPGDWLLHVSAEGYAPYSSAPMLFGPGTHRLEPRLHPARRITFLVEDARGVPADSAWVRATRRNYPVPWRDPAVDFTETLARADAQGTVVLDSLPTAEFLLRVSGRYSMRDFTFLIPAGTTSDESVRLRVDADCSTPPSRPAVVRSRRDNGRNTRERGRGTA